MPNKVTPNMNGLIEASLMQSQLDNFVEKPIANTNENIRIDIPNVCFDNSCCLYIDVFLKSKFHRYRFSPNLAFVKIRSYISEGEHSKSDELVEFNLNGSIMIIKRKNIKGEYVIDHLPAIGVYFFIDAPKTKRSEALNQMVNRTLFVNNCIVVKDSNEWQSLTSRCEY